MTDTRLVVLEPREVDRQLGFTTRQQAIPWCTTHDQIALGIEAYAICYDPEQVPQSQLDYWGQSKPSPNKEGCIISTGGPDHKWWRDR